MIDDRTPAAPAAPELPELETLIGMAGAMARPEVGGLACLDPGAMTAMMSGAHGDR